MITLKHLHKTYTVGKTVVTALNDINLTVKKGEIFGILGKSGAGKSTLLRSVNLLERPSSGEVWVEGVNLTDLTDRALREHRHKIGMVFQHFNLLSSRSVFDNIAFPLEIQKYTREAIQKRVMQLLELVGLSGKHDHHPSQL